MDAKTQYYGEDGPGRSGWYIGWHVTCEILKESRTNAGTPQPPKHCATLPGRHFLAIVYVFFFPSSAFLSFPWIFSCPVFHIVWLLLVGLAVTATMDDLPSPNSICLLSGQQNPKFSQASGPVPGGESWLVQTVVFHLGCTLKHMRYTFKNGDTWTPSQKFWFNCSGVGIKSS